MRRTPARPSPVAGVCAGRAPAPGCLRVTRRARVPRAGARGCGYLIRSSSGARLHRARAGRARSSLPGPRRGPRRRRTTAPGGERAAARDQRRGAPPPGCAPRGGTPGRRAWGRRRGRRRGPPRRPGCRRRAARDPDPREAAWVRGRARPPQTPLRRTDHPHHRNRRRSASGATGRLRAVADTQRGRPAPPSRPPAALPRVGFAARNDAWTTANNYASAPRSVHRQPSLAGPAGACPGSATGAATTGGKSQLDDGRRALGDSRRRRRAVAGPSTNREGNSACHPRLKQRSPSRSP
jgi:hypothetical protein